MKVFWAVLAIAVTACPSPAREIIVDCNGSADFNNIQAAVEAAENGDTVILQQGTYTGNGNRDINFMGKAITVRGATGDPNDCVIDCQGSSTTPHRGFNFVSGEYAHSVLKALTIKNAYGPVIDFYGFIHSTGGAIYCNQSSPHISNCIISNNSAYWGGGIFVGFASNPNIDYCVIINNKTSNSGGGIMSYGGNPKIQNCTISYNTSSAGAIYLIGSQLAQIINCTISNNTATAAIGGIYNSSSNVTISNCIVTNNTVASGSGDGYGIYNYMSKSTIKNCIIRNNSGYTGGGIYNHNSSNATISNCTITGNSCAGGSVTTSGGIKNFYQSTVSIENCIIWDNDEHQITGSGITATYSDIQGGYTGFGNISTDPCFVNAGGGDFHLLAHSPCINTGNPDYIATPDETDIDYENRVIGRIDIGADEVGGKRADFTRDGRIDFDDLYVFATAWLSEPMAANWNQLCDLSNDGRITFPDFDKFADDWL